MKGVKEKPAGRTVRQRGGPREIRNLSAETLRKMRERVLVKKETREDSPASSAEREVTEAGVLTGRAALTSAEKRLRESGAWAEGRDGTPPSSFPAAGRVPLRERMLRSEDVRRRAGRRRPRADSNAGDVPFTEERPLESNGRVPRAGLPRERRFRLRDPATAGNKERDPAAGTDPPDPSFRAADAAPKTAVRVRMREEEQKRILRLGTEKAERAAGVSEAVRRKRILDLRKRLDRAARDTAKAVRAASEALKKLAAAISAGGAGAVVAAFSCAVMAAVLLSPFGVLFSNDTGEDSPMTSVIRRIDAEYAYRIERSVADLSAEGGADEMRVVYGGDGDGDSVSVNNWNDVLGIYSVLCSSGSDTVPAIQVTDRTEEDLREVFLSMNAFDVSSELLEEEDASAPRPTAGPDGTVPAPAKKTVRVITVTQVSKNYREATDAYGFTDQQREVLEELMSPAYYALFAKLAGVDVTGGADLTQILSGLPASGKGPEVVKAALSKLGAPYVWGAKGETRFDCSGLSYWSIRQVDPVLGGKLYTNAAGQAKYCSDRGLLVGAGELQPGDLVFWQNLRCKGCHRWQEVHHVGIYAGNGKVVEASSSKGRVVVRDLWSSANYPIFAYGRPYGN